MMEKRNVMVLFSLVVIASGCAHTAGDTSSTATSDSVTISNYSAFPNDVLNNQQVRLEMTLVNEGEGTAEDVQARLFNVPFSGDNSWDLNSERVIDFGDLEPADEENNLPARESTQYWTADSPDLDDGVTIPYQFMSEVFYKYQTRGTTSVTLMDQQRFREEGNPSRPTLDTTSGPIQMEIRTRSPIVFYPQDGANRNTEMCVVVRNQGQGTPFIHDRVYNGDSYNLEEEDTNKVKVRVQDQGRIGFEAEDGSNTAIVDIFGNRGIGCFTVNADNWNEGVGPQEEVPIVLEAEYGYSKETSTSVTVSGSERFGGSSSSNEDDSQDESSGPDDNPYEPPG